MADGVVEEEETLTANLLFVVFSCLEIKRTGKKNQNSVSWRWIWLLHQPQPPGTWNSISWTRADAKSIVFLRVPPNVLEFTWQKETIHQRAATFAKTCQLILHCVVDDDPSLSAVLFAHYFRLLGNGLFNVVIFLMVEIRKTNKMDVISFAAKNSLMPILPLHCSYNNRYCTTKFYVKHFGHLVVPTISA